jgi:hypothetical protein
MRYPKLTRAFLLATAFLITADGAARFAHAAATIAVVNLDSPGEGFNDPSAPDPDSTNGGNAGATLGAQRLNAFQFAANLWGRLVTSSVTIRVGAQLDRLTCTSTSATLGQAGPNTVHRNFAGALRANTWYTQALANSLAGTDLDPTSDDIGATFNSAIGTTCPFPNVWYYGLDRNPPGTKIDFVTVVLHELGHGLGFLPLVNLATGQKLLGFDDAYMAFLEDHNTGKLYPNMSNAERVTASTATGDLHWVGPNVVAVSRQRLTAGVDPNGHVEMFAPNPQQPGSSVSHFSTSLSPNELMEPRYIVPLHDVGLAKELLADIGWLTSPGGTNLTLTLSLNQSVFRSGNTLRVGLRAQNPGVPVNADFYFGILLPDGVTALFVTSLSPLNGVVTRLDADPRTFRPLLANVQLPQGFDTTFTDFFVYTFAGGEPAGTYAAFTFFTLPGAFNDGRVNPGDVLVIDVRPFAFSP